jgi:hypothetical protein
MILFYSKITGDIFAYTDGRVHNEAQLNVKMTQSNLTEEQTGKLVIGWIEKDGMKTECNLDKFELLQDFESLSPLSPTDFKVNLETGELEHKNAIAK